MKLGFTRMNDMMIKKKNNNFEISSRGLESPSNSKTLINLSFFLSFFLVFFYFLFIIIFFNT